MTHYAIGSGFKSDNTLQDLAALGIYRREAETMARRAAAAGDPLALMALISAYMPDPSQYVHSDAMRNMSEFGFIGYLQQAVTKDLVETMALRSEEHTSELQSLMRLSYAVFCLKKNKQTK